MTLDAFEHHSSKINLAHGATARSSGRVAFVTLRPTLAAFLGIACLLYALVGVVGSALPIGSRISLSDVHPEIGQALIGKLSDPNLSSDKAPSPALLYFVESHRGGLITRLQLIFPHSYVLRYLNALWQQKFPADTYETWEPLGPGNQLHDDIRKSGDGRYSVWKGYLYFSLPVGKKLGSGSSVVLLNPIYSPTKLLVVEHTLRAALAIGILVTSCLLVFGLLYQVLSPVLGKGIVRTLVKNTAPGLFISCVLVLLLAVGGEIYLRATTPFTTDELRWPGHFDPAYGFLFQPGAEMRWTNGLDFWSIQRANSLGFLDREPVIPKPPGTFRIALVGDSFVEAAQLPLEQKQQTILAELLNHDGSGRKYDVVALGYSGTGQSNQLPFLELYEHALQPDLVILEFVNNDFANNSNLLEAIRNGWGIDHPPRLFLQPDGSSQGFHRMRIDPDWSKYILPGGSDVERAENLRKASNFYNKKLGEWNPQRTYIDYEFYENRLPPAFQEAVLATKYSLFEFKRHAQRDGFKLIVVATDNVTGPYTDGRKFNQLRRLKSILHELDIPLLDLYPTFAARGNPDTAHFAHDPHWNTTGHRWAAEGIFDFLKKNGLLGSRKSTASKLSQTQ